MGRKNKNLLRQTMSDTNNCCTSINSCDFNSVLYFQRLVFVNTNLTAAQEHFNGFHVSPEMHTFVQERKKDRKNFCKTFMKSDIFID